MRKKVILFAAVLLCSILCAMYVNADTLRIGTSIYVGNEFVRMGDLDRNEKITVRDALMILKHSARIETYDASFDILADVDDDGVVNVTDALNVLRYITKINEREMILNYRYRNVYTVKLSDNIVPEKLLTAISSYDSYVKYIDDCLKENPDAFGGSAEEIKKKYNSSYFKNDYLVAVCVNNEVSSSVEPEFRGVYKDNGKYEMSIYSYVPLEQQGGVSSWCMFIECDRYDNYIYYPDCVVKYQKECELSVSEQSIGPVKCNIEEYNDEDIIIIDTYESYISYMEQFGEDLSVRAEADNMYNEAYFEKNEMIAVCVPMSADSYSLSIEEMTISEQECMIDMYAVCPVTESAEIAFWLMLIPMEGKQWEDCSYNYEITEFVVEGKATDVASAPIVVKQLRGSGTAQEVKIISTYEEYLDYLRLGNVTYPKEGITGCTEEYFENNSLIVIGEWTPSGGDKMAFNRMEVVDGICKIYIDYFGVGHDCDIGSWRMSIPVEGKQWDNNNVSVVVVNAK